MELSCIRLSLDTKYTHGVASGFSWRCWQRRAAVQPRYFYFRIFLRFALPTFRARAGSV